MRNLDKISTREPTSEPATEPITEPTKHKKYKLKLQHKFMNEIIANEKDANDEIF